MSFLEKCPKPCKLQNDIMIFVQVVGPYTKAEFLFLRGLLRIVPIFELLSFAITGPSPPPGSFT